MFPIRRRFVVILQRNASL